MSNFQMTANVMDKIMSTSIILLDHNSNANDVDIMAFELRVLFHPAAVWGNRRHGPNVQDLGKSFKIICTGFWKMNT